MGHSVYGLSFITLSDSNLVVLDLGLTWARLLSFYNSPPCFRLLCVGEGNMATFSVPWNVRHCNRHILVTPTVKY